MASMEKQQTSLKSKTNIITATCYTLL